MEDITTYIALTISILSFIFTSFFAISSYFSQKMSDKIKRIELREKYFENILSWSDAVIEVTQEATYFILVTPSKDDYSKNLEKRESLRLRCSILIDRGRWIFPNIEEDEYHKFNGYGKDVLNCVVWIYKFISSVDIKNQEENWELRENMLETKREFIDQIKNIVNPKYRTTEYRKIIG